MRKSFTSALKAVLLSAVACGVATSAAAKQTHLLAMAACPPWKVIENDPKLTKLMAEACEKDVATIVPALRKSFAVPEENVMTRLNEQADAPGVWKAMQELAGKAKREDRVIIYINMHGGAMDAKYRGYDVKSEILLTYTANEPRDFSADSIADVWMTTKELRDLINEIDAEEIILILEVCESGASLIDFRYNLGRRYKNDWNGREAIIFSSGAYQAATFNEEGTVALFTETFARNLQEASSGNIRDIFENAALETHRSRRMTCMQDDNLEEFFDNRAVYLDGCTQLPSVFDPYGLLDDIQIGGHTVKSRWAEIKDRKPARKAASKPDDDPFAWARPYLGPLGQAQSVPAGVPPVTVYGYYPWHN